jgi:hypothetical protein
MPNESLVDRMAQLPFRDSLDMAQKTPQQILQTIESAVDLGTTEEGVREELLQGAKDATLATQIVVAIDRAGAKLPALFLWGKEDTAQNAGVSIDRIKAEGFGASLRGCRGR